MRDDATGALRRLATMAAGVVVLAAGLVAAPAAGADVIVTLLERGDRLQQGDSLVSESGRYELRLDRAGQLLLIEQGSWLTGGEETVGAYLGFGVSTLVMQSDGNLVAYAADGRPVWHTFSAGSGAVAARLQDDRNIVLTDAAGRVADSEGTYLRTDLRAPATLLPGDVVQGVPGVSRLVMQTDGNLVHYRGSTPTWSSRTQGNPGAGAVFQRDGNLVVYASEEDGGRPLYATYSRTYEGTTNGVTSYGTLVVEDDEVSVVQRRNDRSSGYAVWGSSWGTNRLASADALDLGDRRTSRDGRCRLLNVGDELLLVCDDLVVWSAGPETPFDDRTTSRWIMQADGNFVGYRYPDGAFAPSAVLSQTGTSVPGSRLVVQDDRNVVVYGPDGRPTWSRLTGRIR